jgi:hypothetical protein
MRASGFNRASLDGNENGFIAPHRPEALRLRPLAQKFGKANVDGFVGHGHRAQAGLYTLHYLPCVASIKRSGRLTEKVLAP